MMLMTCFFGGLLFQSICHSDADIRLHSSWCHSNTALQPYAPPALPYLDFTAVHLDAVELWLVAANPSIVTLRGVMFAFNLQPHLNGVKHHFADLVDDCGIFNSLHVYHLIASNHGINCDRLYHLDCVHYGITQWRFTLRRVMATANECSQPQSKNKGNYVSEIHSGRYFLLRYLRNCRL